jgi:hypothetical protein
MKMKLTLLALLSPLLLWPQAVEQEISSPLPGLFPFLLCPPCPTATGQKASPSQNPEEIIKEFLGTNPPNSKLIAILKNGAIEPYKTKIIKRALEQDPTPEEASEILIQKPVEPYAAQAWKIVEASGLLRVQCYVLSSASEEYQDKAYAFINKRNLIIEEYIFYILQSAPPQRYVRQIWNDFMKLNPAKDNIFSAARTAKGDLKEIAVLYLLNYLLNQKPTSSESEFESVKELILEVQKENEGKREEKLIEIITRKQCP